MLTVTAQANRPTAPQPQLLARRPLAHVPSWRLHAASLFASEPSGPFSFWPRAGEAAKAAPQQPARGKKAEKPATPPAQASLDTFEADAPVGAPRFRSALEQVRSSLANRWSCCGDDSAGGGGGLNAAGDVGCHSHWPPLADRPPHPPPGPPLPAQVSIYTSEQAYMHRND